MSDVQKKRKKKRQLLILPEKRPLEEIAKEEEWKKAERVFVIGENKFQKWYSSISSKVDFLAIVEDREMGTKTYEIILKDGRRMIVTVKLLVDDYYIPSEEINELLSDWLIHEMADGKESVDPAFIAEDLKEMLMSLQWSAHEALRIPYLKPEDAEKMFRMVKAVQKGAQILEDMLEENVERLVSSVALGFVESKEWRKMLENTRREDE